MYLSLVVTDILLDKVECVKQESMRIMKLLTVYFCSLINVLC